MPKPFDASSKHLIENRPADWLRLAGLPLPPSPADVSIVDADLSNVMTTAADKLIRVDNVPGVGSYLAHIEFQSSLDPELDLRILMYNAVTRRRHGLPVLSVVFLLRPQAMSSGVVGRVYDQLNAFSRLDFWYHLIPVWKLYPGAVLDAGVGVLPLAPITAVGPDELPELIAAVKRRLEAELTPQQGKEFLLAMRVLMGLKYQEQLTENLMQTIAEMADSVEWQKIHRRGRDEGKAEGKVEGLVEGERRILVRLGTVKFGPPAAAVTDRLRLISDTDSLGRLSDRLLTATKWEDLFVD